MGGARSITEQIDESPTWQQEKCPWEGLSTPTVRQGAAARRHRTQRGGGAVRARNAPGHKSSRDTTVRPRGHEPAQAQTRAAGTALDCLSMKSCVEGVGHTTPASSTAPDTSTYSLDVGAPSEPPGEGAPDRPREKRTPEPVWRRSLTPELQGGRDTRPAVQGSEAQPRDLQRACRGRSGGVAIPRYSGDFRRLTA